MLARERLRLKEMDVMNMTPKVVLWPPHMHPHWHTCAHLHTCFFFHLLLLFLLSCLVGFLCQSAVI